MYRWPDNLTDLSRAVFLVVALVLSFISPVVAQDTAPGAASPLHIGNQAAPIKIEVFSDYLSPSFGDLNKMLKRIETDYPGKVYLVFRNFPLSIPEHNNSYAAARAVEAAGMQGRFRQMMDLVYINRQRWGEVDAPESLFYRYAVKAGLDLGQFKRDYNGYEVADRIDKDLARVRSLKLNSVPSVLFNDRLLATYEERLELEKLVSESIKPRD